MTRQRWIGQLIRIAALVAPGAALLDSGTSCGDQFRQSLMESSVNAVSSATGTAIENAVLEVLGAGT